jgi:hypothetical protein
MEEEMLTLKRGKARLLRTKTELESEIAAERRDRADKLTHLQETADSLRQ